MSHCTQSDLAKRRLERLQGTGLLDTPPEPAFDRATRLATRLLSTPVALVSVVDQDRLFFKSAVGLGEPLASCRQAQSSPSLCRRVVDQGWPVIIDDARKDPELRENAHVIQLGIVAYLGVPLITDDGCALGALCVVDSVARHWDEDDVATLSDLAASIMTEIGLREQLVIGEREVNERRQAEMRRRESERTLLAVFDATFQFISLLAPDGSLLRTNRSSLEFAGAEADEVIGLPLPETPWWNKKEAIQEQLREAIAEAARGRFVRFETQHAGVEGTEITVDFSLNPVRDESGQVVMLVAEGRDITDRKRAEDDRREADRRKDEFLAVLAHELRNPLAAVAHAVRVLELRDDEPQLRAQMRELIVGQTRTLTRLVDDLLDVARIARGKVRLRPQPLDLSDTVARAVATTRPLMNLRGHRVVTELPGDCVAITADPLRLEQVLVNLLSNAAKYTEPGGVIALGVAVEEPASAGRVRLWVRDNGVGIAPELLPRVFEPFIQADQTLDRSRGGLGVGLTLVRGLVALHGGTVEARSPGVGLGSEFIIRLPAAGPPPWLGAPTEATEEGIRAATAFTSDEANPAGSALPSPAFALAPGSAANTGQVPRKRRGKSRAKPRTLRVLVVDDNVSATEALALILRHWGHTVQVCHDGTSGLAAAAEFHPEVVLLDIGLPGLDGYEVARLLRERPEHRDTVLIAITGYGRDEDRRRAEGAGLDHHFVKPINLDALESLMAAPSLARKPSTPSREATPGRQRGQSAFVQPRLFA